MVFPELCWECRQGFIFQQQRDLREYTQATIYVRKVVEDKAVSGFTTTLKDGPASAMNRSELYVGDGRDGFPVPLRRDSLIGPQEGGSDLKAQLSHIEPAVH